jgi:carboxymethylenebutenolidase
MTDRPNITQAMIDAYDAFTHTHLDRRALMARLTALAGSATAASAALSVIAGNAAHAAIVAENDERLLTSTLGWLDSAGEPMTGYLVRPKGVTRKLPVVLVVHENRGLTPHIRDVARRAALDTGFIALAPDWLSPQGGTPTDEDKARQMIGALDRAKAVADGVAAIDHVRDFQPANGKVGVTGFCWGGGMTNALAVAAGKRLRAAAPFYGPAPADPTKVPDIKAELLIHLAGTDERINAAYPAYRAALDAAKIRYTLHDYPGMQHAFHNDTSAARYDKAAAELAWSRTVEFFKRTLR